VATVSICWTCQPNHPDYRDHRGASLTHRRLRPSSHILQPIAVRSPQELAACHALIIPGGESTVIASVAGRTPGLLEALQDFVRDPTKPVWGTCAGMILMAEQNGIGGGKIIKGKERQQGWGGIEGLKVWRNLYGSKCAVRRSGFP
jgi:5'-phosphate synthase pdxT subunit